MEDTQIKKLLFDRAESAIEALQQEYGGRLYATALNILGDAGDAEECVSDTYLALWNAIPPEDPDPLCAYAFRVGRNIALKRLRSNTAQKRSCSYTLSLDELQACVGSASAEDILSARELGLAINRFLGMLPPEDRFLFLRRYWYGDSIGDIAAAAARKENAVSVRLSRIRKKLKNYLRKEGILHEA